MNDEGMEQLVCALHGKQYTCYCDDCEILLCPSCTGCEEHKKVTFDQMKAEVDSKKDINVEDLKKKAQEHIESNKKRLETYEGNVNLSQMAVTTITERSKTFEEDSKKDIEAFNTLYKKLEANLANVKSEVLKAKLTEALKKSFTAEDAEKEKTSMIEEKKRLETRLEKDRKDYNKVYQKVLLMGILVEM